MLKVVGASWEQTRVSTYILVSIALFGLIVIIFGGEFSSDSNNDGIYSASVFWKRGVGYRMEFWGQGNDLPAIPEGAARAYYSPDLQQTGWSKIEIESNEAYPDWVQAYAAGLLEGSLSWQLIHWHWQNTVEKACENIEDECKTIRETLRNNSDNIRTKAVQLSEVNTYWHQVRLFYAQIDGIETGWRYAVKRSRQNVHIPSEDFLWMNVHSDIVDMARKLHVDIDESNYQFTLGSTLIKLFDKANISVHVAHSASKMYHSMLRIVKKYNLNYHETGTPNSKPIPGSIITMSSYPGVIGSQDNMYIISSQSALYSDHNLVVTGTPISNFNEQLWNKTSIEDKVLTSIKVLVSNRLAKTGRDWWENFAVENGGTGLKQWLVLNLSRKKNSTVPDDKNEGLLWVIEQIPGRCQGSDQSHRLNNSTYWASYGLPFYKEIREETGAINAEKRGNIFSYSKCPKAKLYRQCRTNCSTAEEIFNVMRHGIDPSLDSVGDRGDLYLSPIPFGVIDNKIYTSSAGKIVDFQLISGPTYSENEIKNFDNFIEEEKTSKPFILPFRWSSSQFKDILHYGQPDLWQFLPIKPTWIWH